MNVNELIIYLSKFKENGYGKYKIIDDGYGNEIKIKNIMIDDKNKEVIL